MLRAKELGLDKVMLDCTVTNIGSDATIRALGGVLERTAIDPSDITLTNVYWIDVAKSLEDHGQEYEPYIAGDKKVK